MLTTQASIKFTAEPPQGVKPGLKRTYGIITQDQLDISNMPQWKPLLYVVAFLHTTVQVSIAITGAAVAESLTIATPCDSSEGLGK